MDRDGGLGRGARGESAATETAAAAVAGHEGRSENTRGASPGRHKSSKDRKRKSSKDHMHKSSKDRKHKRHKQQKDGKHRRERRGSSSSSSAGGEADSGANTSSDERPRGKGRGDDGDDGGVWVEKRPASGDVAGSRGSPTHAAPQVDSASPAAARPDWMSERTGEDVFGFGSGPAPKRKSQRELEAEEEEARRLAIRKERELNPSYFDKPSTPTAPQASIEQPKRAFEFGDRGANWRMMKLKRVFDIAGEEGRSVDDVALERYGSVEAFQEALDERAFLDKANNVKPKDSIGSYRPSISGTSRFQMPGGQPHDQLNKLNAEVLKARLMRKPNLKELEQNYQREKARAEMHKASGVQIVVVPTIDERGRMIDLGQGLSRETSGGKQAREQTHDKAGNRLRYTSAEEGQSVKDMMLQEKLAQRTSFDEDLSRRIAKDGAFRDDLEYLDDSAERFARKKDMSDDLKKRFAIDNYKKSQDALSKCSFCFRDGEAPRATVVSIGVKTYLALPETVEMLPGHCLIVPVQHALTSLELEDDAWDEIRNFQKCLLQMAAAQNKGVLFMEQVVNFKWHKHTVIECYPVPMSLFEDAPAYYKACWRDPTDRDLQEALSAAEEEWSQHQKVIVTDRGFRRSMVKNLPYFHVWFDPNRGLGHVIEDPEEWRPWFGREVIASVLDLPPDRWRKPRRAQPHEARQRLEAFRARWAPFDWTKMLDGE
ncbi:Pre-mRNA-splicing factor cwf19 [Polyrhizophydium stewartii]|uniref:Pre-mRNA-splicing factor cwf19 n=1 Tax=Polyrhizophydium stewartii TaxID=2732419 RepID=A0ABR4NJN9_9FUNG